MLPRKVSVWAYLVVMLSAAVTVSADVPHLIDCQGRLTDASGNPLEGSYKVTFSIYDVPDGGEPVWQEERKVSTGVDGLFQVQLGSETLTGFVFKDSARYLGIQVGDDPELAPRIHLTSVPYAYHSLSADVAETASSAPNYLPLAGGTMTGTTFHNSVDSYWQAGGSFRVGIFPASSMLYIEGANGSSSAALEGTLFGGVLSLFDGQSRLTAVLDGNELGGGSLWLGAPGGELIYMRAAGTGDNSVILPQDAIDATEILDEPGIAEENLNARIAVPPLSMIDLVTVTITVPTFGYIVLDGRGTGMIYGTTGRNFCIVLIDSIPGEGPLGPNYTFFGSDSPPNTGIIAFPVAVSRTFFAYRGAGTYTFRMKAYQTEDNAVDATDEIDYPSLRATYYPSSYGSVAAMVSSGEAGQFEKAEAVSVPTGPDGKGPATTMYQVDLRELELKAAKAHAAALQADMELMRAKMEEQSKQATDGKAR